MLTCVHEEEDLNNEELLEKIGVFMKPLVSGIAHLKTEASHMKTAVEALKTGQDDVREKVVGLQAGQQAIRAEMATKADIKRLEQKIEQATKDHEERIKQLELAHHHNAYSICSHHCPYIFSNPYL